MDFEVAPAGEHSRGPVGGFDQGVSEARWAEAQKSIRHGKAHRDAAADGVSGEGLHGPSELKTVGKALSGTSPATTIVEGGGRLDRIAPGETEDAGFAMIMHPMKGICQAWRGTMRPREIEKGAMRCRAPRWT